MMKRTLFTFLAAAAISTPAMIAPAVFTPAAAQASLNLNIGIPMAMPAPYVEVLPGPRPGYLWDAGYWRWEGNRRFWEPGRWREERRYAEHRGWYDHGHYYR